MWLIPGCSPATGLPLIRLSSSAHTQVLAFRVDAQLSQVWFWAELASSNVTTQHAAAEVAIRAASLPRFEQAAAVLDQQAYASWSNSGAKAARSAI